MKDAIKRLAHNDMLLKKCTNNENFRIMILKQRQTILDTLRSQMNREIMKVNNELKLV